MIREIQEIYKQRDDLLRAEVRLTLQIKSIQRRLCTVDTLSSSSASNGLSLNDTQKHDANGHNGGGDHSHSDSLLTSVAAPLMAAKDIIHKEKLGVERLLKKKTKELPAHEFVDMHRGFGTIGLGMIVGECGDLSNYANPAKIWKRMGLAVIDGERQRKCLNKEKAIKHGYCPRRRAVMHVIGESLIKQGEHFKDVYDIRKKYEIKKAPDLPPIAHHKRAMRYMEKRLLKDLWEYWNGLSDSDPLVSHAVPRLQSNVTLRVNAPLLP